MKIFVFLFLWVPGSCCLCKAQGNERRSITSKLSEFLPNNEVLQPTEKSGETTPQRPPVPSFSHHQAFESSAFIPGMPRMRSLEKGNPTGKYLGMAESRPQPTVKLGKICAAKVALSGFMLLAGNIPYYIKSLRSQDKSGLKLTSQKCRIAAGNKGFKRVTGFTFAVPLARKF